MLEGKQPFSFSNGNGRSLAMMNISDLTTDPRREFRRACGNMSNGSSDDVTNVIGLKS